MDITISDDDVLQFKRHKTDQIAERSTQSTRNPNSSTNSRPSKFSSQVDSTQNTFMQQLDDMNTGLSFVS
jgi:hypothetical protein